jgi:hypothetical protein
VAIATTVSATTESPTPTTSAADGRSQASASFAYPSSSIAATSGNAMTLSGAPSGEMVPKWCAVIGVATVQATTATTIAPRSHCPAIAAVVAT